MTTLAYPQSSTTVRVNAPTAAKLLFAAAQAAGTPVAAALLEKFFLTPKRGALSAEEAAFLATGEFEAFEVEGKQLATWSWGEGRTALLAHGWGSRGARFRTIAPALVAAGYRVVTYDAPGHGASEGKRSSLPETAHALRRIAERERERRGAWPALMVAHSFGCAATIMAQEHFAVDRTVLLAPAADFDGYVARITDALGVGVRVANAMIRRVERRLNISWESIRVADLARTRTQRALIFHDPADAEVPFSDAQMLANAWRDSTLVPVHGLGHKRLLHAAAVVDRNVEFAG